MAAPSFEDPKQALDRAFASAFGSIEAQPSPAEQLVKGRGVRDEVAYHVGIASSGATHAFVIFSVREAEEALYRDRIDAAFEGLTGLGSPLHPFPHRRVRWTALLSFAALAVAGWLAFSRIWDVPYIMLGRRLALMVIAVGILVMTVAWVWLAGQGPSLVLTGESPASVGMELGLLSLLPAGLVLGFGAYMNSTRHKVQSAPEDGAFSRSTSGPNPIVTSGEMPVSAKGHPDGKSELEDPSAGADLQEVSAPILEPVLPELMPTPLPSAPPSGKRPGPVAGEIAEAIDQDHETVPIRVDAESGTSAVSE